jgi:hypothetical protein
MEGTWNTPASLGLRWWYARRFQRVASYLRVSGSCFFLHIYMLISEINYPAPRISKYNFLLFFSTVVQHLDIIRVFHFFPQSYRAASWYYQSFSFFSTVVPCSILILSEFFIFFHSRTVQHLDVIRVFHLPTDAQGSCFENIKIYIKTAPTCFGLITIINERINLAW